jgi:hypothetical protein
VVIDAEPYLEQTVNTVIYQRGKESDVHTETRILEPTARVFVLVSESTDKTDDVWHTATPDGEGISGKDIRDYAKGVFRTQK